MISLLLAWLAALFLLSALTVVIAWAFHRSTRPRAEMIELAPIRESMARSEGPYR